MVLCTYKKSGKQDTTVAILFCITSILILDKIQKRYASKIDLVLISLLVFFIFEIKVSGVIIFVLYFILIFILIKNNEYRLKFDISSKSNNTLWSYLVIKKHHDNRLFDFPPLIYLL